MITEIANMALGSLLGGIGQNRRNEKQLEQQDKLLGIQSKWNKDMYDYQQQKQIEMANALGSKWQVEQLKNAGLSVGLMSSKGGLQPTLGGGAPSVGANQAQQQQSFMDMAAQAANIKLMNAQAEKATAEANKTAGVDTEKTTTEIKSLTQGMNESRAKTRLIDFQADSEEYNVNLKHDTYEQLVEQTKIATKNAVQGLRLLQNQSDYNEQTYNERVKLVTGELLSQELTNKALELARDKTQGEIDQIRQNIAASKATISQGWQKLSQEAQKIGIDWFNANVNQQNAMSNAAQASAAGLNAGTNRINAATNAARLEWDKYINNVRESTKLTVNTIKDIGQSLINKIPSVSTSNVNVTKNN